MQNFMLKILHTKSYLEFNGNFWFLRMSYFGASGDNLGLKHPANCKQVVFAAVVQKKPKRCRALKAAKRP